MVLHSAAPAWLLAFAIALAMGGHARGEEASDQPAGLFERDSLSGDWGGVRTDLKNAGVAISGTETIDMLGVVDGGPRRGATTEGRLELDLDLDLEKILGWSNAVLHANAYQIHGRGLSANELANNLLTPSNIEATRAFRLFDLWVEKGFLDNALSVRVGQLAADDEFFINQYAGTLINANFGWPTIMAQALPDGGPVYPLTTPGIRVKDALNDRLSIQFAIFNGDPADGPGALDPQRRDGNGLAFNFDRAPFLILEASYAAAITDGEQSPASVYRLGVWGHTDRFDDLGVDRSGLSLADPRSSGQPRAHNGDFGVYATADQLLYREPGSQDRGLGAFARVGGAPGDRNFVSLYADIGLAYKGPFAGRDDDLASVGFAVARISDQARQLDSELALQSGTSIRVPDYEGAIELTYQYAAAPWWSIQPDAQLIIHPTSAIVRPTAPDGVARSGNAVIVGLRSSIRF